uniref:Proline rich 13 n=1 Tax=Molossus molossus TaxID=27622 RepID=A0A7J8G0U4_MOLMO|nr:proline rich 13 [Molossus molossus]
MASIPPPPPAVTLTEYRVWTLPSSLSSSALPSSFRCHLALEKISPCVPLSLSPNLSLTLLSTPNWLEEMGNELPWASKGHLLSACIELLADEFYRRSIF